MKTKSSVLFRGMEATLAGAKYIFLILGASITLFILLNCVAEFLLNRQQSQIPDNLFNHVSQPESPLGISVLKRIFKVDTPEAALERVRSAPSFEMHPGLHYMTARTSNKHYRIGVEGIRYDHGWDDEHVRKLLSGTQPLVFLMGGSTMLGHGVSGDETISWYLNQLLASGKSAVALNFGAQAYDEHREIEKLVYLLHEGYRPRHVIFLDGWNDIAGVARSNMRWQDKVIFHGFAVNRGEIAFTPAARIGAVNVARLFVESLPVTRFLETRRRRLITVDTIKPSRDPFMDGFDFAEADWMFFNWHLYAQKHRESLKSQIEKSFRNNLQLLTGLSQAFGFKLTVLFQPLGLFDSGNPFVPLDVRSTSDYQFLDELNKLVRSEIKSGNLAMVDISDTLADIKGDRYVDVAHYSPTANERLARLMFSKVTR